MTPTKQREFNYPAQYTTGSETHSDDDNWSDIVPLEEGDLVLAATDGLWDNIHPGFLRLLVNGMYLQFNSSPDEIGSWAVEFADVYACFMERNHRFLQKSFFSKKHNPKLEESGIGRPVVFPEVSPCKRCTSSHDLKNEAGLTKWIEDYTQPLAANKQTPTSLLDMFREFLACPILEMIDADGYSFVKSETTPPIDNCIDQIFQKYVHLTDKMLSEFALTMHSGKLSNILGKVALRFSEMPSFPSLFFLNAWKAGEFEGRTGSGKIDDITVIFSPLIPQETDFAPNVDDYLREATAGKAWVEGQLKDDLEHALTTLAVNPRLYI
jgi:hypothetical protein